MNLLKKFFTKNYQQRQQQKIQKNRCKPWFKVNGDKTLRLNYPLTKESLVLDLGGFKGDFANDIFNKYHCAVYIFEPVNAFYTTIKKRFKDNDSIKVFPWGMSNSDKTLHISNSADASSIFIESDNGEKIQLKSIVNFIKENKITEVDLIKINIEGGEYEVLDALIENDLIKIFKNLQIQFHDFIIENAQEKMEAIQKELSKTHKITYQYSFVWENWERK